MTTEQAGSETAIDRDAVRRAWPDNLRVLLTVLVLAHHSALTYGHLPLWPYTELAPAGDPGGALLDLLVYGNQTWFMGLFFLVSGLFVPTSCDRRGERGFVRSRLLRLGLPYLVFVLVLRPLFTLPAYLSTPAEARQPPPVWYLLSWDSGPLWFVLVLLVFSVGYALLRRLGARPAAQWQLPRLRSQIGGVLLLGLGVGVIRALWRQLVPDGSY